ncbi:hypothetical protein QN277_017093 [Acacia crassicarpa]|uniref:Uncharacterized protein n=1 Tax=Acacia crassicarpa TaxID=499986 RepID=A0AAE1MTR2_9FABA|nr:hypothetical protein QN277_017093 [Acacia crassicarpa]
METSGANSEHYAISSSSTSSAVGANNSNSNSSAGPETWYGMRLTPVSPFRSPVSFLLSYAGILRSSSSARDSEAVIVNSGVTSPETRSQHSESGASCSSSADEVSIRIIGAAEQEQNVALGSFSTSSLNQLGQVDHVDLMENRGGMLPLDDDAAGRSGSVPLASSTTPATSGQVDENVGNTSESNNGDPSSYQRYDIQQAAKWIEQILPFSLLLLVVFIRQHLQGTTTIHLFHVYVHFGFMLNGTMRNMLLPYFFLLVMCTVP